VVLEKEDELWQKVMIRREDIVTRRIAGETILVPVRGTMDDMQRIFSLNPLGAQIWEMMDGKKSLGEIRDEVLRLFEAGEEEVDSDIREFIADLSGADLLTEVR